MSRTTPRGGTDDELKVTSLGVTGPEATTTAWRGSSHRVATGRLSPSGLELTTQRYVPAATGVKGSDV